MSVVLLLGLLLTIAVVAAARSVAKRRAPDARTTTEPLDAFVARALEDELAAFATGVASPSQAERAPLARALRGDPDPALVSKIEQAVRALELEFATYPHEVDVEVTLRVRYEDGRQSEKRTRLGRAALPADVLDDLDRTKATRAFRSWAFPWATHRVVAF